MARSDRVRWEKRYTDANPALYKRVPGVLEDYVPPAEPGMRALELACGLGRSAMWLAEHGYDKLHFELPMQEVTRDGSETNAVIDCLAEGPRGLLIVDHKSGPCPDPVTRFVSYQPQLNAYAELVQRRWPDKALNGTAVLWMSEGTLSVAATFVEKPA